jgi:hypothetical protein
MPFYIQNTSLYFPDKKTATIIIKNGMVRKPTCVRSYKLIEKTIQGELQEPKK